MQFLLRPMLDLSVALVVMCILVITLLTYE